MIVELSSLLVEAVTSAVALMSEAKRRKTSVAAASIVNALPTLDFASLIEASTSARLASMLRGALTKDHFLLVAQDRQVRRLISELLLVRIIDANSDTIDQVSELVTTRIDEMLHEDAAADDIHFLSTQLIELTLDFCGKMMKAASELAPEIALGIQQLATFAEDSVYHRTSERSAGVQPKSEFRREHRREESFR